MQTAMASICSQTVIFFNKTQITDFTVGNNGMVYLTAFYDQAIYTLDLNIGQPSFKIWIQDPRLYSVGGIAMDKAKQNLFVSTISTYKTSPTILHISRDGTINVLYNNVTAPVGLLVTDLTLCK